MSYKATVLKVMLASPSDVPLERRVVRDVVQEWNAVHAEDRRVVLMPADWESHASPEMGDRPQAIINRQVLEGSDILVAIFWTRLGSPTGVSPSGTAEEIEEHIATGKPAMIYFSTAPVRMDSVDSAQYEALTKFKAVLKGKGLIFEFEDLSGFREAFSRHLAQTIIRGFTSEETEEDTPLASGLEAPSLSAEARALLAEAIKDPSGVIMKLMTMDESHVQTNNFDFVEQGNRRSEAKWRSAVDELNDAGLIEDRGGKGEVFFLTDEGYRVGDSAGPR